MTGIEGLWTILTAEDCMGTRPFRLDVRFNFASVVEQGVLVRKANDYVLLNIDLSDQR